MRPWKLASSLLPLVTMLSACASTAPETPPPPPLPTPSPTPVAAATAVPIAANPKQDEWNIFPDPTTGRIEVYHYGVYVGSITGDEKEDPPLPHKVKPGLTE
jgi:hypothetical protein